MILKRPIYLAENNKNKTLIIRQTTGSWLTCLHIWFSLIWKQNFTWMSILKN